MIHSFHMFKIYSNILEHFRTCLDMFLINLERFEHIEDFQTILK